MNVLVPTGFSVMSKDEQKLIPPKLLPFNYTIGTFYAYTQILKKNIDEWSIANKDGTARTDDIIDMLWAGLVDIENVEGSMTRNEIARSYTSRSAPWVNTMVVRVIEASTPIPTEAILKKMKEEAAKTDKKKR